MIRDEKSEEVEQVVLKPGSIKINEELVTFFSKQKREFQRLPEQGLRRDSDIQ